MFVLAAGQGDPCQLQAGTVSNMLAALQLTLHFPSSIRLHVAKVVENLPW